ncbi:PTS sugar transporter subunit IIC [Enterococcus sp. BWR-S5]|uniref:PTS sugar transporter subunit IIC n=1 Tax=Enterococcus sp. BWR-S5 TaxID=2787714 RepID=UPI00192440C8|nr:PTS transporter subunit EIIC [Enterococcus sp. BWR-S5]MBL1225016.1 PTS sugar transporter subunit IIC [Enterococcus sp. BWR-S5]
MDKYMDSVLTFADKISNNKYLKAISNGLMATLPVNIIGSIALLLAVLPIEGWKNFIASINLGGYFSVGYSMTVGVISLYAAFLVGHRLATEFNQSAVPAGIVSLFAFLMMTPLTTLDETTTLDMSKLGAEGLFTAMICGLVFARIYCLILEKNISIKMPAGVPQFVSDTFAGLIPAIIVGFIAIIISWLFSFTTYGSFSDFVYQLLASPLQSLSSSVGSLVFIVLIQMVLWFFGIHGSLVVGSFITALYLPMDVQNMDALASGVARSDLPNILSKSFYDLFAGIGGAGGTLSLIIVILLLAKSKQSRTVANLSAVPGMFTINEPMIFGLPLILNPLMAIPFILTPLVQTLVAYLAIWSGLFPRLSGIQVPFGTPIFLNGFLAGGWQIALLQIICVLAGCLLYLPFVKIMDKEKVKSEEQAAAMEASETESEKLSVDGKTV